MILLNISEWIVNLLIAGIGILVWTVSVFIGLMTMAVIKKWIDNFIARFK